jgi:hypothetical protein
MGKPTKNGNARGQLTAFANKAGISPSYAFQIETGAKPVNLEMAGKIYSRTRRKFGPLASASNRDCAAVVRVMEQAGLLAA